ncbi:MAG: hypothetical protein V1688_03950 [bacterium]
MNTVAAMQNLIKIGQEPIVILPLKKWQETEELREELEYQVRFMAANEESRGQEGITLDKLKTKYNF